MNKLVTTIYGARLLEFWEKDPDLYSIQSVVRFLEKMDIKVAWWQFKVSWASSHVICQC